MRPRDKCTQVMCTHRHKLVARCPPVLNELVQGCWAAGHAPRQGVHDDNTYTHTAGSTRVRGIEFVLVLTRKSKSQRATQLLSLYTLTHPLAPVTLSRTSGGPYASNRRAVQFPSLPPMLQSLASKLQPMCMWCRATTLHSLCTAGETGSLRPIGS